MEIKHINWLYRMLGYEECTKCHKVLRKTKFVTTGIAGLNFDEKFNIKKANEFYLCNDCTNEFLKIAFENKNNANFIDKFLQGGSKNAKTNNRNKKI